MHAPTVLQTFVPGRVLALWLVLASLAIPGTLLWDNAWESTIGIDRIWSAPHLALHAAVALLALAGTLALFHGSRIGSRSSPLGAWIILWGTAAYAGAAVFDRWWQLNYGLAAGIWHPPQLLKAVACFALTLGAWLVVRHRPFASAAAAGAVLALIFVVSLAETIANRQHSAPFYMAAACSYPVVLAAAAIAGPMRFPATCAASVCTLLAAAAVWIFPLIPGEPLAGPIYHPRTTLLPPPFPPLLFVPALALDLLLRVLPGRRLGWSASVEAGLAFLLAFGVVQWTFASFLLSPAADHWFFAGGGKQWPFFLQLAPEAQTAFWQTPGEALTLLRSLAAATLAIISSRVGLYLGTWMKASQR
jgi:hypothetical protein